MFYKRQAQPLRGFAVPRSGAVGLRQGGSGWCAERIHQTRSCLLFEKRLSGRVEGFEGAGQAMFAKRPQRRLQGRWWPFLWLG